MSEIMVTEIKVLNEKIEQLTKELMECRRVEAFLEGQRNVLELITHDAPLTTVLKGLVSTIEEQSNTSVLASILLLDEDGIHLRHGAAPSLPESYCKAIDGATIGPFAGSCGTAAFRKEPVIVTDIAVDPLWADYRHLALSHGLRACWSTPIFSFLGEVLGTFAMYYHESRAPSPLDMKLIAIATRTAAIAIERKKERKVIQENEKLLKDREQRFRLLAEMSSVLASTLDYEDMLKRICQLVVPALADFCFFEMLKEKNRIERVAWLHASPVQQEILDSGCPSFPPQQFKDHPIPKALATGRMIFVKEVNDEWMQRVAMSPEHLQFLRNLKPHSWITVLLIAREQTLGALTLCRTEPDRLFTLSDVEFAQDVASRIALAVQNVKLYNEAQEASRMKDEFLATVSHELRTPVNAMLGWMQLLRTGKLDEAGASRALETVERNARSQAQLIGDLLDVTRIISGKLHVDLHPIEPMVIIGAAINAMRPVAENKGIDLQLLVESQTGQVLADKERLQQVIWNLLSNAIKFSPPQECVQVRLEHIDSFVHISVSDQGEGISPEFLPYVFDRFQQADSAKMKNHGGLGLGLAIARHLIELHGGTIQAYSEGPGHGATFTIQLPLIIKETDQFPIDTFNLGDNFIGAFDCPSVLDGLRLFVVEDDPDSRELLITVLEKCGAKVTAASTVSEAMEKLELEEIKPDLLVSDINMPGEDGYSLIKRVRSLSNVDLKKIPAIALTAYARVEDRLRALMAGFDTHVAKPFEPEELVTVIVTLARRNKDIQ